MQIAIITASKVGRPVERPGQRPGRTASGESIPGFRRGRAALALGRLARHHGMTRRDLLERLIVAADAAITAELDPRSREWDACFRVTPAA